jgi:hypothetical protein
MIEVPCHMTKGFECCVWRASSNRSVDGNAEEPRSVY